MTYVSNSEIKARIDFNGEDFYDINPEQKFDELITNLEEDSRAEINGQIGGRTYEKETDRTDTLDAPDKDILELVFPIQSISQVETFRRDGWKTLDDERYEHTAHNLELLPVIRHEYGNYLRYRHENPLSQRTKELVWCDIATRVRVTYDRGYDEIPHMIKEAQIDMVNRMLIHLRQDQNISKIKPDQVTEQLKNRTILTEDIMERLGRVSRPKNKYTVL